MFKKIVVGVFVLFWLALAINPVHPGIWAMENLIVAIVFPVVLWLDNKYKFTNWTFLVLTVFVILHLFGAHFTYEKMYYFTWFSDLFGWERNYYDQFIHLLFGLMVFMPFFEVFYHQGYSRNLSYLIAFLFIGAVSAWYEILEWLAMVIFCREPDCSQFVTQKDVWDAQKDMAYAVIGAVITLLLHRYLSKEGRKMQGTNKTPN
jgi:putative membrane protein